jgi:hypothetical protein
MNSCVQKLQFVLVLAAACGTGQNEGISDSSPRVSSAAGVVRGFSGAVQHSRLAIGTQLSFDAVQGWSRTVGTAGVLAVRPNGALMGVLNGDAPVSRAALTRDVNDHNSAVLHYFQDAGLPPDQVKDVSVTTVMKSASGSADAFLAFNSIVNRQASGVVVADSYAWARFNDNGETVGEGSYWPPLPSSVVQEAVKLQAVLDNSATRDTYTARISVKGEGHVVIRHTGATTDPFVARASYDINEPQRLGSSTIRHFDVNGDEFKMPDELVTPGRRRVAAASLK